MVYEIPLSIQIFLPGIMPKYKSYSPYLAQIMLISCKIRGEIAAILGNLIKILYEIPPNDFTPYLFDIKLTACHFYQNN